MRNRISRLPILILALAALAFGPALAGDGWLHVRVSEDGSRGDDVMINIPLSFVQSLLPAIQHENFDGGILRLDEFETEGLDLRELLDAVRNAPDANFVTVQGPDGNVRVMKEKGFLKVHADDDGERVRISLPLEFVDAMLDADHNELNLMAALEVLANARHGDLVTVESDDSFVRIWVDDRPDQ